MSDTYADSRRRIAPAKSQHKELPSHYYHDHFLEMLAFIETHYCPVLDEEHAQFSADFRVLSFPAQCVYVRLLNRQGQLFTRRSLRYAEIPSLHEALDELEAAEFVTAPSISCLPELLKLTTRPDLLAAMQTQLPGLKRSLSKTELVTLAKNTFTVEQLFQLLANQQVVAQGRYTTAQFLLFLYFGQVQDGLTPFTLRDLGLVRTQAADADYEPRFADREEAHSAFYFAKRLHTLDQDKHTATALYEELDRWPPAVGAAVEWRDALALTLGKALEADADAALHVYARGESMKCTERRVRLLLTHGRRAEAKAYLEGCIDRPRCDEEALFASDLYQRKFNKKRTSALTDELRAAKVIDIDDAFRGAPEYAAVRWFQHQGQRAYRAENRLWRTLFGLLFWDLLFEGPNASVHSPFERLPSVLTEGQFLKSHKAAITKRLALLDDPSAVKRRLIQTSAANYGTPNGLFRWRQSTHEALFALLESAPPRALQEQLLRFCDKYDTARQGNPDLLVIDDVGARFIEIKAPGDQLRRHQLLRLEQLRASGLRADIVRVRYVLDPQQAYAVVDVETTGGRGEHHRVTEIAAVKVINGVVVDQFHSLVNPQRTIPASITRLTGIDNSMVADAPLFSDIAESFLQFLEGSIFVAHNVEFDYKFVSQEFQRWGHTLRMPKLCTCASMRKLYPGHKSYGLAALANTFDIPLKQHHRALCDAEAAAQLLVLINAKREALLAEATANEHI